MTSSSYVGDECTLKLARLTDFSVLMFLSHSALQFCTKYHNSARPWEHVINVFIALTAISKPVIFWVVEKQLEAKQQETKQEWLVRPKFSKVRQQSRRHCQDCLMVTKSDSIGHKSGI